MQGSRESWKMQWKLLKVVFRDNGNLHGKCGGKWHGNWCYIETCSTQEDDVGNHDPFNKDPVRLM